MFNKTTFLSNMRLCVSSMCWVRRIIIPTSIALRIGFASSESIAYLLFVDENQPSKSMGVFPCWTTGESKTETTSKCI